MKFKGLENGRGSADVSFYGMTIDAMIAEFMDKENIPGMSLAIVQAPYIPRVVGYGVSEIEYGKLVSVNTVWPVGEISQGYTAVAIMQLYEKGELDIYTSISAYLSSLPEEWKKVTVMELLQHSSGIADYRHSLGFKENNIYSIEELFDLVKGLPLKFKPGTAVEKSATNFLILSEIIEKVSKMSYYEFIEKYQFQVLGIKNTMFYKDIKNLYQENLAQSNGHHELFKSDPKYINPFEVPKGYREQEGDFQETSLKYLEGATGKGFSDIWATVENISFWDIGLAGSVLIKKPENRDLIYKSTKLTDGEIYPAMAGWVFYAHPGLMDIKGSSSGFSTFLSRFTDKSELVCVTLTANRENVDLTDLARRVAGAFDKKLALMNDPKDFFSYESSFGFKETLNRLEKELEKLNIPIFAKFDHAQNAREVSLDLRESTVVVFGSPKVGTLLMEINQTLALELPLKILVLEDSAGSVWIEFRKISSLVKDYDLAPHPLVGKMEKLMENLTIKAGSAY